MFASRFACCNQALVFKSHVSTLRYRLTDCHSERQMTGWYTQLCFPAELPQRRAWAVVSGNDTSCSSVWRQAREGSPSGWTSPPRAACSPRPKAERIPLIVQEQRGIIKHPPSPRPALVIAVLQESKLIQSPDGALDLPLYFSTGKRQDTAEVL